MNAFRVWIGVFMAIFLTAEVQAGVLNRRYGDGPCAVAKKEILQLQQMFGQFMAHLSLPSCDSFGYYSPLQCNVAGCYCADPQGDVLEKLEWSNEEYCISIREN